MNDGGFLTSFRTIIPWTIGPVMENPGRKYRQVTFLYAISPAAKGHLFGYPGLV